MCVCGVRPDPFNRKEFPSFLTRSSVFFSQFDLKKKTQILIFFPLFSLVFSSFCCCSSSSVAAAHRFGSVSYCLCILRGLLWTLYENLFCTLPRLRVGKNTNTQTWSTAAAAAFVFTPFRFFTDGMECTQHNTRYVRQQSGRRSGQVRRRFRWQCDGQQRRQRLPRYRYRLVHGRHSQSLPR